MPLTKDKGSITRYGGGVLKILEVDDSGTPVSGATAQDLGYIQETTISDATNVESVQDETGNVVQNFAGNREVKLTAVLMQTDKALIDFLVNDAKGKYYQVYYLANRNVNGKIQEVFFAIGKIRPSIEINSLQRRIPIEINFLKNETQINISSPSTTYGAYANSVTIGAGDYYEIVETTPTP